MSTVQNLTEDQFQVHVGDQGAGGTFLIVRPNYDDQTLPLYGLVEEGSKININRLANRCSTTSCRMRTRSRQFSNGARPMAWIVITTPFPTPYQCKGAPFESVEELLMVRGITRQIMYGDGTAPPLGQRTNILSNTGANAVLSDSQLSRGVFDLLTIWSDEPTSLPDGTQRVQVTSSNTLRRLLQNLQNAGDAQPILRRFVTNRFPPNLNLMQLAVQGGMSSVDLDEIADYMRPPQTSTTHIEVNQAPPSVLYALVGLNGIQQTDIDTLLAARQQQNPQVGTIGWVIDTLGPRAAALGRYITNRSYYFSADIHAYADNGRAFKRVRIVIDSRTSTPEIVYRRDISDRPDPMDQTNIDSLRKGQGLAIGSTSAFSSRGGIQ